MEQRIRESVLVGNVYRALSEKFIDPFDLLEWLAVNQINTRTLVAYLYLSNEYIHPDKQYLKNGNHFLLEAPDYYHIALHFNIDGNIPRSTTSSKLLIDKICEKVCSTDCGLKFIISMILYDEEPQNSDTLAIQYLARKFYYRNFSNENINKELTKSDWVEKFRYTDDLPAIILERVKYLMDNAPCYYNNLIKAQYLEVLKKLQSERLLIKLTYEELMELAEIFPEIVDRRIFNYKNNWWKIALLSPMLAGYFLGYPIDVVSPTDQDVYQSLDKINEIGVDAYCENVKLLVESNNEIKIPFFTKKLSVINETNVLGDNINEFPLFDIVYYAEGSALYRFTRAEFKNLLESKKNPYTGLWLPDGILSVIKSKYDFAVKLCLPDSLPLKELITSLGSNTLSFSAAEKSSTSSSSSRQYALRNADISTLLNFIVGRELY